MHEYVPLTPSRIDWQNRTDVEEALECDDIEWLEMMLDEEYIDKSDVIEAMNSLGWSDDNQTSMLMELGLCSDE